MHSQSTSNSVNFQKGFPTFSNYNETEARHRIKAARELKIPAYPCQNTDK